MLKTFLGLLVVAQVASAGLLGPKVKVNPGKDINEYLVNLLPENQDLDQNLEAASEWKQQLSNDAKIKPAIIDGLSILESLHEVIKKPQCDFNTYNVVEKSAKLVGDDCLSYFIPNQRLFRTQYIVRRAAKKVAKACMDHHKAELLKRMDRLDAETIRRAEALPQMCKDEGPFSYQRNICTMTKNDIQKDDLPVMVLAILNRLQAGPEDPNLRYLRLVSDEKGNMVVREDKVKEVVKQYITEPCRVLRKELGDLISLARRDPVYLGLASELASPSSTYTFRNLTPAYCLCAFFARYGDEVISQSAINLVPRAKDSGLWSAKGGH